ncbi:transcriptional regulator [Planotetraspora thailandica]|uniref:Transcriptional regulator n=1 Tax=Planotetraspora thailandica TaxID=487172 RepID=A0A8J3V8Z0_9ACTN|nr:transcriptional regulator [Planotetraspora thailandica]
MLRALRRAAPVDALIRRHGPQPSELRREEVAIMAGISPAYYARLEEGRETEPCDQVLHGLSRAFDLDAAASEHMFDVAHPRERPQVSQQVVRTVEGWYHAPVFAVNHQLDVLAANSLARTLFKGMDHADNLMRHAFLAPVAHQFFPDWEQEARSKVAHLRAATDGEHTSPALRDLVEQLCSESKEFRQLWSRGDMDPGEFKHMYHPEIGHLNLRHDTLNMQSSPDVLLFVCSADPGTSSEEALTLLSILAADDE